MTPPGPKRRQKATTTADPQPPAAPPAGPDDRFLHHNNVDALLWLQTSAEAYACYLQTFELARLRIVEALQVDPPLGKRWCVFSDLDETMLDNSAYNEWLVASGRNFDEAGSWERYCEEAISLATPGAVEFATWLMDQRDPSGDGVDLVYVTSRREVIREATARNLELLGLPLPDGSADPERTHLFMKGTALPDRPGSEKFDQYAFVADARDLEPILWLGDNCADFDARFRLAPDATDGGRRFEVARAERGRWGRTWIQFPNPVYGGFLQYLRRGTTQALADDNAGKVSGDQQARLPRRADAPRPTPKAAALDPWAAEPPVVRR